jgi:hypothetical protein
VVTITGHHARLGTRLLARLCCGGYPRPLNFMRLQGATLAELPVRRRWFLKTWISTELLGFGPEIVNLDLMIHFLRLIVTQVVLILRSRAELQVENLALRHQIEIFKRTAPKRTRLTKTDRLIFTWLLRPPEGMFGNSSVIGAWI